MLAHPMAVERPSNLEATELNNQLIAVGEGFPGTETPCNLQGARHRFTFSSSRVVPLFMSI